MEMLRSLRGDKHEFCLAVIKFKQLNLQKTNYIIFSTNNSDSTIQIAINGSNIEKVNSTKYLGVYIDHHLNWNDHIAYISSKLSKSTPVIHKTSHVLDTKTLTLLYNAIIFPYLNYCVEVWGNTYETNLYSLFIKQKKAIRIVCHAKYLDHTSRLFYKLKLLKSPDIVHFNTCILCTKHFIIFYLFQYKYTSLDLLAKSIIFMFTLQERRGRNFLSQG